MHWFACQFWQAQHQFCQAGCKAALTVNQETRVFGHSRKTVINCSVAQSQAGGAAGPSVLSVDDAVSALTDAVEWTRIGHFSLPGARI